MFCYTKHWKRYWHAKYTICYATLLAIRFPKQHSAYLLRGRASDLLWTPASRGQHARQTTSSVIQLYLFSL